MMRSGKRLEEYRLAPPPIDRFVRSPSQSWLRVRATRESGIGLEPGKHEDGSGWIPIPFFWHDPPWYVASPAHARAVAQAVAGCGMTIGVNQSDLGDEPASGAAGSGAAGSGAAGNASPAGASLGLASLGNATRSGSMSGAGGEIHWSRLVPQRCDRAGWTLDDCQMAKVIEVRLGMGRGQRGGYEYDPRQYQRWHPAAGGVPPVPLLFPPEWGDLSMVGAKVRQLRVLGDAAVYFSCDESQVDRLLPEVVTGGGDGVIVLCAGDPAAMLVRCGRVLDRIPIGQRPRVWVSGPELDVDDAVKCFALGASGVAIDSICNAWLTDEAMAKAFATQPSGFGFGGSAGKNQQQKFLDAIRERLIGMCDRLAAILQSLMVRSIEELGPGHLVTRGHLVIDGPLVDGPLVDGPRLIDGHRVVDGELVGDGDRTT